LRYLLLIAVLTATLSSSPAISSTLSEENAPSSHHADRKTQVGTASHYGRGHAGLRTASGERFNPEAMTCAHRTLPLGSVVKVTNIETGKHVDVTVNDRGPYIRGRIVDLSERAARELGVGDRGLLHVSIEVANDGPG
jgi:rare lipoprotein A